MTDEVSNNIVHFPKSNRIANAPKNIEEIYTNLDILKRLHVDETLVLVSSMILEQLAIVGFDYSDEGEEFAAKETVFFLEALQALLFKKYGMEHAFHELADKILLTNPDKTITMRDDVKELISKMKGKNI